MGILDSVISASKAEGAAHVNILVYGNSGVGKSKLGAGSSERPLIALTERQAMITIRESNPQAAMVEINCWEDLQALFKEANEGIRAGTFPYDCIVLDSLTEMQTKLRRELEKGKDAKLIQGDGSLSMKGWGVLIDRTTSLVSSFRDLPIDFVCLCLCDEQVNEETGVRTYRPSVNGRKLPGDLASFHNAVWYLFTTSANPLEDPAHEKGRELQYVALTRGASSEYLTKGHEALATYENPSDVRQMMDLMRSYWKEREVSPRRAVEVSARAERVAAIAKKPHTKKAGK
jgi:hypothetical protein